MRLIDKIDIFLEESESQYTKSILKKYIKDGKGFVVFASGGGHSDNKIIKLSPENVKK